MSSATPTEDHAGWVLRPAEHADADAVAEIHLAARAEAPMPVPVHSPDEVRAWLAGRIAADPAGEEVWVAEVDGRAAAYARFTATWLDDLYVAPGHQGTGLGTALLDLVKSLRPDGFGLWVFETNLPAQRFYARRGLAVTERTDGSANEERAPDLRMEWPGAR